MLHHAQFKQFEFVLLYGTIPLLFFFDFLPINLLMPILLIMSIYCFFVLKVTHHEPILKGFKKEELGFILVRFVVAGGIFLMGSYFLYPDVFFKLVLNETKLFIFILILYPLISVIPQELVYREFFFRRYHWSISRSNLLVLNTIVFSFAHNVFGNGVVLLLTLVAGFLLAHTYVKSRSLILVCLEHTLYGYILFVSGLAELFFDNGTLDAVSAFLS